MRRISLALALFGAVAAAGCGGGAKPAATAGAKGTAGQSFTLTVNNQGPGTIADSSSPAQTCAAGATCAWTYAFGTSVTLTATASGSNYFNGFFGDCQGPTCTLSGNADKYVVSYFSATPQAHPNWAAGHGNNIDCSKCHGANYQGQGIAPSCSSCHSAPTTGHFDATAAAWSSHENSSPCYRCHTTQGFQNWVGLIGTAGYEGVPAGTYIGGNFVVSTGVTPVSGPLTCDACHNSVTDPNTAGITDILFRSGVKVTTTKVIALCGQCHSGREGQVSIDAVIGTKLPGNFTVSFKNPHYFGAAGVMFGSNTHMMYEYTGKTYATYPVFYGPGATNGAAPGPYGSPHGGKCTGCHVANGGDHFTKVDLASTVPSGGSTRFPAGSFGACDTCHVNAGPGADHRLEPVQANVAELAAQLLAEINTYQLAGGQSPICYNANGGGTYFFQTTANGGGVCGATDTVAYTTFDAKSVKAAFNLQWSQKEPGAFAHNGDYVFQTLIDSIQDLDAAGANAVLPCDAHDSLCQAAQLSEGVLTPAGAPYTGAAFIVRP
jgi:hypothetical protein